MGRYLSHTVPPSGPQGGWRFESWEESHSGEYEDAAKARKIPIITITARGASTKATGEKLMGNAD